MRFALRNLSFLTISLVLISSLMAQDKDKKDSKDSTDSKEKLIKVNEVLGKVTHVDAMEKSFQLQVGKQNVKVTTIDDVKVRTKNPPVAYDDKGNKKRYTPKELKELKGDSKLPGYNAGFEDLKNNQIVQVTLVRKKGDKNPQQYLASVILIVNQAN